MYRCGTGTAESIADRVAGSGLRECRPRDPVAGRHRSQTGTPEEKPAGRPVHQMWPHYCTRPQHRC